MAIDTKSVSQLITEFRKLQAKDAITQEFAFIFFCEQSKSFFIG